MVTLLPFLTRLGSPLMLVARWHAIRSIRECYFQCAGEQSPPLEVDACTCGTPGTIMAADTSLMRHARLQWASATFRLARRPAPTTTPAALRSR